MRFALCASRRQLLTPISQLFLLLCWCLPLLWLWFRLIDHLRIEWSVNAQYGYGYAVPFLCAYLIWQSAKREAQGAGREAQGASRLPLGAWGLALGAFLYLPIRLVQEANPEWRLVSWALALVVIGITLSAWRKARGARREARGAFRLALRARRLALRAWRFAR